MLRKIYSHQAFKLLKHGPISKIDKSLINFIKNKYKSISFGQYLMERLIHQKINTAFMYSSILQPISEIRKNYDEQKILRKVNLQKGDKKKKNNQTKDW